MLSRRKTLGASTLLKYIAKMLDASVDQIRGYRVDVNNKPEMHTFEVYRKNAIARNNSSWRIV